MSKTKMRCNTCGKWFQSANARDVTCPDCVQKARKEKLAAKNNPSPAKATGPANQGASARPVSPPPKPKHSQSGTNQWLDSLNDVKMAQPQPPRPKQVTPAPRDTHPRPGSEPLGTHGPSAPGVPRDPLDRRPGGYREGDLRAPVDYRGGTFGTSSTFGQRPRQPSEGGFGRGPRPGPDRVEKPRFGKPDRQGGGKPKAKGNRPTTPPKPKREKIPPPKPFEPTEEQVKQVEERYLELATPVEFDGIRTQISKELAIPKTAVKKIVKELRARNGIPSWWEAQSYRGSEEDLQRVRDAYVPLLPVPPVGVHKQIAEQLSLKPGLVYQAIKAIRQEMNLPQYNDPVLHASEQAQTQATIGQQAPTEKEPPEPPAQAATTQATEEQHAEPTVVTQENVVSVGTTEGQEA